MSRHFPLLIFISSTVLFLGLRWSGYQEEELPAKPPLEDDRRGNDSRESSLSEVHAREHAIGKPSDAPEPSVVWLFKESGRLTDKLNTCDVPNSLRNRERTSNVGWFRIGNERILLFTKRLQDPNATIKLHLKTLSCLFYRTIEAQDALTKRRFNAENWPRIDKSEGLPLAVFIELKSTNTGMETVGLHRLGKFELRLKKINDVGVIWRIVSLYLVSKELNQTLKAYSLPYRAVEMKDKYLLEHVGHVNSAASDAEPVRRSRTKRSSTKPIGTAKKPKPSNPPKTRKMPEYR